MASSSSTPPAPPRNPVLASILRRALKQNDGDPRDIGLIVNNDGALYKLAAAEAGQNIDIGALYAQATAAAQAPAPTTAPGPTSQPAPVAPAPAAPSSDHVAEMVATLVDVTKEGDDDSLEELRQLRRDVRNLTQTLAAQKAS